VAIYSIISCNRTTNLLKSISLKKACFYPLFLVHYLNKNPAMLAHGRFSDSQVLSFLSEPGVEKLNFFAIHFTPRVVVAPHNKRFV